MASKPDQSGLSNSIRLENVCIYEPNTCTQTVTWQSKFVHMYTTSKQIELESPGCSGFETF